MTLQTFPLIKPQKISSPFLTISWIAPWSNGSSRLSKIFRPDRNRPGRPGTLLRELNQAANRLAHALLARLEPGEAPVILLMDDKTASIIAILAVLKAGRIYLSLEPARPVEHLEKIFKDAGPALVICNSASQSVARQVAQAGVDILNLDLLEDGFSDENPNIPLSPESKAVIFYTSGSTGNPRSGRRSPRGASFCVD